MMNRQIKKIAEKLKDERSKKIVFVSHCLLNENVRYLGGAFRKGGIDEIIDELQKQGIGIVQMKCPEQKAWGGVLKKYGLPLYGLKKYSPNLYRFRKIILSLFIWQTNRVYGNLAREIADEIDDYINSGFEVLGIIGIDGSPSCGVNTALDIGKSMEFITAIDVENLKRDEMNDRMYKECLVNNKGLFIKMLKKELKRKNIQIKFFSYNLVSEIRKESAGVWNF